jgi:hypothetical protein
MRTHEIQQTYSSLDGVRGIQAETICLHLGTIARAPICTVKFRNIKPQISTSGAKICIVDDDTPVLRSLKELLASDDLDAETFDDPEKFLDYA